MAYKRQDASVTEDHDIIRPPALLKNCDAPTCAAVVSQPSDPYGLSPCSEVRPQAAFYGYLSATDSAAVNKKVSKWVAAAVQESNKKYGHCQHAIVGVTPAPTTALGEETDTDTDDESDEDDAASDQGDVLGHTSNEAAATGTTNATAPGNASGATSGAHVGAAAPKLLPGDGALAAAIDGVVEADVSHGDSAAGDPQKPFAVHLPQYCCQHMTGNVVEACTKFLGVLSPTFCMASCLSHGDIADQLLADVDDYIEKNMEVDDPAERPLAPSEEKELQFQEDLLEACYVITLAIAIPLSVLQGVPLPLRVAIA